MRNLNRRLARVPVWAASLLLVLSVLTWGGIASAQLSWANETVEAAKAQATSARTETAHVKAELVRKERALAEANARLRQVGEKPVDPDKVTAPPVVAPLVTAAAYVAEWRQSHGR